MGCSSTPVVALNMLPNLPVLNQPVIEPIAIFQQVEVKEEPKPVQYVIVYGDNLTKIAEANGTTPDRLFDKNTNIGHPDQINPGEVIVIPAADEVLTDRPVAAIINTFNLKESQKSSPRGSFSSIGNTYDKGYCTWYSKAKRPDLPNRMGNAINWTRAASAAGFATGSTPRAGAIGQLGNHVVYVESVNGDGTFNLSEMNYAGLGVVSGRNSVSPRGWQFIY